MKIEVFSTKIDGVRIIKSDMHQDDRGAFFESFSQSEFVKHGLEFEFRQHNVSYSHQGVLRGMHIQRKNPQGKLIRCLAGVIWDVWVDLRPDSPTKGKWESLSLNSESGECVYIPPGLAHGFFVPSRYAMIHYMCTTQYDKGSDGGIRYDDPAVGITWPFDDEFQPMVSLKDLNLPTMSEYFETLR